MEQITENNKLIAEFMGRKPETDGISWFDENYKLIIYNDWNSLMPVVEKIAQSKRVWMETIHRETTSKNPYVAIHIGKSYGRTEKIIRVKDEIKLLNAYYSAVVEFIKWFNENKEA